MLITDEVTAGAHQENNIIINPLLGGEVVTIIEEREVGLEAAVTIQDLTKEEKEIHHAVL